MQRIFNLALRPAFSDQSFAVCLKIVTCKDQCFQYQASILLWVTISPLAKHCLNSVSLARPILSTCICSLGPRPWGGALFLLNMYPNCSQLLYPPQTLFVGGILFSRCPCVRPCVRPCVCPSVRPSVTLCFLNNSKSHCWIFIKPCKHVHICKTNTLDKKVRARGQFY